MNVAGLLMSIALGSLLCGAMTSNAAPGVTLQKDQTGHFRTMGAVNGFPIYFLLDTGASITSVTPTVAAQSGLTRQRCVPVTVSTANGITSGCAYTGKIEFGEISVQGTIHSLPSLSANLLGMNALAGLVIQQDGNHMTISKGHPIPSSISITPVGSRAPVTLSDKTTTVVPWRSKVVTLSHEDSVNRVMAKIQHFLVVPDGVVKNTNAIVKVKNLPNGEVLNVEIVRKSGQRSFDEAAVNAVWHASPLPWRENMERSLELTIPAGN